MALYYPFKSVKAVQTGPLSMPNQAVMPLGQNNPNSPAQAHSLQVVVNGIGNCSATVQFVGSNDGVSWINYGAAVTATGANADITPGTGGGTGTTPYTFICAYVTAISGTQAAATAIVSA
jgi:hypothetical protein